MVRLNNIKPKKAMKFLKKNGWEHINTKGTHYTLHKEDENGNDLFCQVITNNKTIYWKNAARMIKKSKIPIEEWIKGCK